MKKTNRVSEVRKRINEGMTRDLITFPVVVLIIIFIAVCVMFFSNSVSGSYYYKGQFDELNHYWKMDAGRLNLTYTLPVKVDVEGGEEIVMAKRLPNDLPKFYSIVSRNYHMQMIVTVEGEEIYRYPKEYTWFSRFSISDDWNVIELSENMAGKVIEIRLIPNERTGFTGYIRPVYYGQTNATLQYLKTQYALFFALGMTILASGLLLLVMGLSFGRYYRNDTRTIIGMMVTITGIWITNRSKMPILGMGSSTAFYACFVALSVVPILPYIYCMQRFPANKYNKISAIGFRVNATIILGMLLFSAIAGYPIDKLAIIPYIMVAVSMIYTSHFLYYYGFGKGQDKVPPREALMNKIEFITTVLMMIGFIYETVAYTDELMTEVNIFNRVAFNIYALGHMINLGISSYYGIKDKEETMSKLHDSQMELMMGQIQPHFVFNTLSSIRTLIKIDPDTAYNMTYDFSNYLRANVDNITNLNGIKFSSELEHIKSYVNIEKVRFGDRLHVEYNPGPMDFMVPPLSIQPLVENAIKHGVCQRPEGGTVWLTSYEEGDNYVVEIKDDGMGFDTSILSEDLNDINSDYDTMANLTGNGSESHKSTGMKNIILRLKEMANATLDIQSEVGKGTDIKVLFPKKEEEIEANEENR